MSALPRRLAVAFTSLVVSLALLTGLARAGDRYFYCDAMGMLATDPCAQVSDDEDAAIAVHPQHLDCCEVRTLPSIPTGTEAAARSVPPATLTAILPPPAFPIVRLAVRPRAPAFAFERWRSAPRPPGEARARLMVFLT